MNYLSSANFKFDIKRLPNVSFFAQECEIPSLEIGSVTIGTPLVDYPIIGDKINFSPFELKFIVDENLNNYNEIFNWIVGMGFPKDHSQYTRYRNFPNDSSMYSDATLAILKNSLSYNKSIRFMDMFPVSLSQINLSSLLRENEPVICSATFLYSLFEFKAD